MSLLERLAIIGLALLCLSCCCINDVVHDEEPEDQPLNWGAHGEGRAEDI